MIKNIRKRWLEKHAEKHSNEEIKEYISGFLGEPHPPPEHIVATSPGRYVWGLTTKDEYKRRYRITLTPWGSVDVDGFPILYSTKKEFTDRIDVFRWVAQEPFERLGAKLKELMEKHTGGKVPGYILGVK